MRILAALALALLALAPVCAAAQTAPPSLPRGSSPAPRLPPAPQGPAGGSGNYVVSSAANERAAFLWIVDAIQQTVMLCEKESAAKDFTCVKKPLP